jgi:hypothetical protein
MENNKVTLVIILGIAAVFSLYYGITSAPKGKSILPPEEIAVYPAGGNLLPGIAVPAKRQAKKTEFKAWGRNPFLPGSAAAVLDLSGILWDEEAPKAIISGNIVAVGDKVEGNTVVDIRPDRVILNDGNKTIELKL